MSCILDLMIPPHSILHVPTYPHINFCSTSSALLCLSVEFTDCLNITVSKKNNAYAAADNSSPEIEQLWRLKGNVSEQPPPPPSSIYNVAAHKNILSAMLINMATDHDET